MKTKAVTKRKARHKRAKASVSGASAPEVQEVPKLERQPVEQVPEQLTQPETSSEQLIVENTKTEIETLEQSIKEELPQCKTVVMQEEELPATELPEQPIREQLLERPEDLRELLEEREPATELPEQPIREQLLERPEDLRDLLERDLPELLEEREPELLEEREQEPEIEELLEEVSTVSLYLYIFNLF